MSLFVVFLWSTSLVIVKVEGNGVAPLYYAGLRYVLASIPLVAISIVKNRGAVLSKYSLGRYLALGATGYFFAQGLLYIGIYSLSTAAVAVILNLMPVFAIALSIPTTREYPSGTETAAVGLALVGVMLFFSKDGMGAVNIKGIAAMACASASWALHSLLIRKISLERDHRSVIDNTAYPMLFGSLMMLGASAVSGDVTAFDPSIAPSLVWLAFVNTSLAFVLWNMAHAHLRAYEVSMAHNTMVFQASLLAWAALGDSLDRFEAMGVLTLFAALALLEYGRKLQARFDSAPERILKHVK